jgi:hypothetical protein
MPQIMHLKIVNLFLSFASILPPQQGQFIFFKKEYRYKIIWVSNYYYLGGYSEYSIRLLK